MTTTTRNKKLTSWPEIDLFFQGRAPVHETLARLIDVLEEADIHYAIMGGMAVNAHGHEQTTNDVDVLVTRRSLGAFKRFGVPGRFKPVEGKPCGFQDETNGVLVDVHLTGLSLGATFPARSHFLSRKRFGSALRRGGTLTYQPWSN